MTATIIKFPTPNKDKGWIEGNDLPEHTFEVIEYVDDETEKVLGTVSSIDLETAMRHYLMIEHGVTFEEI
jgi:hypothetical protein